MEKQTFITGLICLIFFLMFIGIVVWISAEVQNRRFQNSVIHLRELIKQFEVNERNYIIINREFEDMYCYSDTQKDEIKKLWARFQMKFKSVSPYTDIT